MPDTEIRCNECGQVVPQPRYTVGDRVTLGRRHERAKVGVVVDTRWTAIGEEIRYSYDDIEGHSSPWVSALYIWPAGGSS